MRDDRDGADEVLLTTGQVAKRLGVSPATVSGWVRQGVLTEHVQHRGDTLSLEPGQSRVFGPGYAHHVRNLGPDPAVSLHVYRAVRTMRVIEDRPAELAGQAIVRPTSTLPRVAFE